MTEPLLRLTADDLTGLANSMSEAEGLLGALERRLDAPAETAEACWMSDAASSTTGSTGG